LKQIYIIGNTLLLAAIGWVLYFHSEYQEPPPDKILSKTPRQAEAIPRIQPKISPVINLEPVWKRSLFASYRGESLTHEQHVAAPQKKAAMELIGICKFGKTTGAIIIDKTPQRSMRRPLPGQTSKTGRSKYYRLGQTLVSGYTLKAIHKKSVVLVRGSEELELGLEFGDSTSLARNKTEVKTQQNRIDAAENGETKAVVIKDPAAVKPNPLPTAALPSTTDSKTQTVKEKIRQIEEMRKRLRKTAEERMRKLNK